MIGWLKGTLHSRDPSKGSVILAVGGVGYEVRVSLQTLSQIGEELGNECELWIHTHAREDQLVLFGFASIAEKQMFLMLTRVPKVGPRYAMAVLGGFPLDDLIHILVAAQQGKLEKIPGIGKKTAEQILLSTRDKAEKMLAATGTAPPKSEGKKPKAAPLDALSAEATEVLVNLGWRPKQVEKALTAILAREPELTKGRLDDLVRKALAQLMGR